MTWKNYFSFIEKLLDFYATMHLFGHKMLKMYMSNDISVIKYRT